MCKTKLLVSLCLVAGLSVSGSASANLAHSPSQNLLDLADQAAKRHGLEHHLFRALVEHESGWKADAISPRGAVGLTQLMPATAKAECGLDETELHDPQQNLDCGARYLSRQVERFGDVKQALCAFNVGPNRLAKLGRCPNFKVTRRYVEKVLATREAAFLRTNGL